MRLATTTAAGILLAACLVAPAAGQQSVIQIAGHAWETGGFPLSAVDDELQIVGLVTDVSAPLYWQPWQYSFTFAIRDVVSLGGSLFGTTWVVPYAGGLFTIYRDGLPSNHDYGVNPPNATSPSTFMDGNGIYLDGQFTEFLLTYNTATSAGSISGTLDFTGGIVFPNLTDPAGWTFGSTLGNVSPAGYDLYVNGSVYTNGPIAADEATWSGLKALYR